MPTGFGRHVTSPTCELKRTEKKRSMMAIDFKMDQTTGIRELDVPMKIIHCNKSFTEDGNLDHFLVELGHKMPVFCKSIDCLDDGQLSYLQFTDSIEHRSSLPIEEMLSPLLVLLVCERIFREYVLVDHLSDQSRSTDNIYASYNQVLIDFDGILVLLSEIRGETVLTAIDKSLSPDLKSNKNLQRLHRRTKHIIEDLCTLVSCCPSPPCISSHFILLFRIGAYRL